MVDLIAKNYTERKPHYSSVVFRVTSFAICSGIEGDLLACVAMCPAVRDKLGPALIHTFSSVDIVEGLDVDKEEFDKFSARYGLVIYFSSYGDKKHVA